jgi:hypothetical protein
MTRPPTKIHFRLLGSESIWIWLNVMVSFCAIIPSVLKYVMLYAFATMGYLGRLGGFALIGGLFILFVLLPFIAKTGVIVCAPVAILAAILLSLLLASRKIPWTAKLLTLAFDLSALYLMYHSVAELHVQYLHGAFRGLPPSA